MSVIHQSERQRFIVSLDGDEAVLEYKEPQAGIVDFCRTFVPEAMRGRGIAGQLVAEGVKWARMQGLEIQPSCSYVQKWLQQESG